MPEIAAQFIRLIPAAKAKVMGNQTHRDLIADRCKFNLAALWLAAPNKTPVVRGNVPFHPIRVHCDPHLFQARPMKLI